MYLSREYLLEVININLGRISAIKQQIKNNPEQALENIKDIEKSLKDAKLHLKKGQLPATI